MQEEGTRLDVVIVGGCGHVGLPLGLMLARAGLQVGLLDTDEERREAVRAGRMPFIEHGADAILAEVLGKRLHVVDANERAAEAEYVVVTIGTPVDEHLNPRFGPLFDVVRDLVPYLGERSHLMLRSTVYPGTTRELARTLERLGSRVQLSYCPERIIQGYAISELEQLPQIVSGLTPEAVDGATRFWNHLTSRVIAVEFEEAELAKLYLNAWRYIQFAISNQFFMMAEERGADFFRIHHAMTAGYERARDFPLPGFTAGPCLLKDTMQLAAFHRGNFQLGQAAMLVNEGLANFIVDSLRMRYDDLAGKRIGILGMAFKANIDDTRDSLAYKLRKLLTFHGADVLASDLFVDDPSLVSAEEVLASADVIVIGAPHDAYREVEIPLEKDVVDVWGFLGRRLVSA
jgi:UDP-N-acetyl-D-mannosaminuronic acid dehydrogenase